jgi:hypothetical protein
LNSTWAPNSHNCYSVFTAKFITPFVDLSTTN